MAQHHSSTSFRSSIRGRSLLAGFVLIGLSACGSSSSESDESVDTLVDAREVIQEAEELGVSALQVALSKTVDVTAFRTISAAGQTMTLQSAGLDLRTQANIEQPASIAEVDADGDLMVTIDLGPAFGIEDVDVGFVMWQNADQVLMDLRSYETIAEMNPAILDTPFRPGLARVDLSVAADVGGDEIARLITGQPPTDLADLAAGLLELDGIDAAETADGGSYELVAAYGEVLTALGQDAADLALTAASGIAPIIGEDAADLALVYESVYRSAPADLVVVIEDGLLAQVEVTTDLSSIWAEIGLGDEPDAALVVETITRFEVDPSINVDMPASDGYEDRTLEFVELFDI